ncbi:MAG: DUF1385 domain-containing protein [Oscillospiraceae bacterium]
MSDKQKNKAVHRTSIGGQAVIEGVMMRNPMGKTAMAVRQQSKEIVLEEWNAEAPTAWYKKTPFIRGVFNFIDMIRLGYSCLMKSAELSGMEDEPDPFEEKMKDKLGKHYDTLFQGTVILFSLILVMGMFVFLPTFTVSFIKPYVSSDLALTAIEGCVKMVIFLLYLWAISQMGDIKRTFKYHGAEHKTIACYEHDMELTVENVRKYTRFHPRCGTSFLIIVMIISILIFSFISWGNIFIRMGLKILLLPVVMGITYEIIKFAGRHDNLFTRIISAPGLWTQRLTTKEPDDEMLEVAIAAMKAVIPKDNSKVEW